MGKSVAYKRRLKRNQKRKKRKARAEARANKAVESGGPLVDELQSEDVYNGGTEVQDEAADVTNEGNIEVHVAESRESDDESMIELYKHVLRTNRIKLKK